MWFSIPSAAFNRMPHKSHYDYEFNCSPNVYWPPQGTVARYKYCTVLTSGITGDIPCPTYAAANEAMKQ